MSEPSKEEKARASCTCEKCVDCCKRTPGWFAPGEAERAAELLGLDFETFRERYLITDHQFTINEDIEVLAPSGEASRADFRSSYLHGRCVFLDEHDRCQIHEAKPFECRETMGCADVQVSRRPEIAELWKKARDRELKEERK